MPGFYLGILLLEGTLQLSRWLGRPGEPLLPAGGFGWGWHLLLPTVALAVRPAAEVARLLAELIGEELDREYMRMARAKGYSRWAAVLRHALPNVAATAAVAIGSTLRYVISSLIVVELLFGWQGLGMRLAQALTPRVDGRPSEAMLLHPETVAALLTIFAALYLVAGMLGDGASLVLDPRQRRREVPAPARPAPVRTAAP
jgi:peptide/nickel transport system permease protein